MIKCDNQVWTILWFQVQTATYRPPINDRRLSPRLWCACVSYLIIFIVQICWLQSWEYLFDFSPLGFHSVCICLTFLQCAFSHQLDLVLSTTSINSSRVSRLGLHTTSQYIGVSYIYCLLMFGLSKIQITIWLVNSTCPCGPHIQIIPRGYHIQVHIYLSFPHLQTEWRQKSMESSAIGSLPVFCLESETW